MIYLSKKPSETKKLAMKLAKNLKGGEILCLVGDLGGGKTCFTKGLASGLGIKKLISSPSFVLMKVHPVKKAKIKRFCHADLYRLKNPDDIINLGIKEYLEEKNTVCVIEWADKIKDVLRLYKKIVLEFQFIDKNTRKIIIKKSFFSY